ncbi:MAG TPA: prepilin peptidase [Planctomycetaceae bacterium]|nr:prepilin peptidase [Planctomycetaceae bacterium]HIQ22461.1 prepilin peptidase [Planctomycetota bacterium]
MLPATLSPAQIHVLLALWMFALGSAVGSFLNVVIYRLPRRMSLIHPGSHCPGCGHPIRWYDNIPMASWLALRGRCRDCGTRISPRYPLVEAATGLVFVAIVMTDGLSPGGDLAPRAAGGPAAFLPAPMMTAALVGYHLLLLCTLFAAAWIESDGHSLPLRLFGPAALVGVILPIALPGLRSPPAWPTLGGPAAGLAEGLVGLAAGFAVGWLSALAVRRRRRAGFAASTTVLGLLLGWQAAVVLGPAALLLHSAAVASARWWRPLERLGPTAWLAAGTFAWILGPRGVCHVLVR